jgi:uncharacterized membrane protein
LAAITTETRASGRFGRLRLPVVAVACLCLAAALITVERAWLALAQPLWFDEAWTAAVAATPDWRSFLTEAYNDVNAPLYYLLMRLWEGLAGPSDFALRAPALLALLAAGAIPIASRTKGLSFEARLTWGAMIFGWWGVGVFLDGRCYALLLALSTLQCVLFARLLLAPSRRNAWIWCGVAACAILLQYYAVIGAAAQGLVYLAARRREAVRTWPALLAFAPAFGWMAFHAPRLQAFAAGEVAWHPLVGPIEALGFTAFAFNPSTPVVLPLVAIVVLAGLLLPKARAEADGPGEPATHLWLVAGAALVALALTLISGALRPSLTGRYLIPLVPGLLLGVVLLARRSARPQPAYVALMVLYLGVAVRPGALANSLRQGAPYGHEEASSTLMRRGVTHVVFVWDHEVAPIMAPSSLQRVGAVFFRRAGDPALVTPLAPHPGEDVNRLALAAATGPRPGIIWIYNRHGATSARTFPPRIARIDPRWTCERSGDDMVGALACYRAP